MPNPNGFVFGPPVIEQIGEPTILAEARRRSEVLFNEDCTTANRYKDNALIAEPHRRAEIQRDWQAATNKAQARHAARLDYVTHEILGHARSPKGPPRPVAVPRFSDEGYAEAKAQAERAQAEVEAKRDRETADNLRSARLWWERHAEDIRAAVAQPRPTPVTRNEFFGPDGLRERYLTKLAKAAAEADGYVFAGDF